MRRVSLTGSRWHWPHCYAVRPCQPQQPPAQDGAFRALADRYFDDHYKLHPSQATADGFHQFDAQLENRTRATRVSEVQSLHNYLQQFEAMTPATLSPDARIDRELLVIGLQPAP